MHKFAFCRTTEHKSNTLLQNYVRNHGVMDLLKVGILLVGFLFVIFVYLYYVNLASTRGYFLRKANQNYDAVNFQFEIVKTDLLSLKQKNRDIIHNGNYKHDIIKLNTEIVYVSDDDTSLAFNK